EATGFVEARDPSGNTLVATADGLRHSGGTGIQFVRDAKGRIARLVGPDGLTVDYGYDANGDLATVTDADGRATRMSYHPDPAHRLKDVSDPLGRVGVSYEYDAAGRLVATVDANGNRTQEAWNPGGFTGAITDRNGNVTSLAYDSRGNVTRETDALGGVTTTVYGDPSNPDKPTARTDARGNTTRWTYDARGNLTGLQPPIGFGESFQATYSAAGDVLTRSTFDGQTSQFSYDGQRRLTRRQVAGEPTVDYAYSAEGYLVRESVTESGASDPIAVTTREYSTLGRLERVANNRGFSVQTTYAANGTLLHATLPGGGAYGFTYDAQGVLTGETDPLGNHTVIQTDPDGTIRFTDRLGRTALRHVATDGKVEKVVRPGGTAIVGGYDPQRNLVALTDAAGNVSRLEYDALNRPVRYTDAAGASATKAYDPVGNVIEIVNRNGKRRTFEHDANNRITHERWHGPDGAVVRDFAYSYFHGALYQVTDGSSSWDILGALPRPSQVSVAYPGQVRRNVLYNWERNGVAGPGGGGPCCGTSEVVAGDSTAPTQITLTGGSDFFFMTATYLGSALQRLQWSPPNNFFEGPDIQFARDAGGLVSEIRRYQGSSPALRSRTTFAWDPLGRLVGQSHLDAVGAPLHPDAVATLVRDAESRIVGIARAGDVTANTYDVLDQLVAVAHTAGPSESYSYDATGVRIASHRLPGPSLVGPGNRVLKAGPLGFSYDGEGNVVEKTDAATGQVTRYRYDHRNQLVLATVHPDAAAPAATTVAFEYDYAGRMMSRSVDGAKTWIVYDRQMPVAEFADGALAVNAAFLYSPDRLDDFHAVWRAGTGVRLLLKDHMGTVLGATDAAGKLAWWRDVDAFGNPRGGQPAGNEPLGFAGRFHNAALGLYEMRARFYDPWLGRFTQEDPLEFAGGDMNLYGYAGNNPLMRNDPTGKLAALEYAALIQDIASTLDGALHNAEFMAKLFGYVANRVGGGSGGFPSSDGLGGGIPWGPFVEAGSDLKSLSGY
ncbi:MAG: hypothetical protein DVB31_02875, partial [Verrucomicrobia bacterium]